MLTTRWPQPAHQQRTDMAFVAHGTTLVVGYATRDMLSQAFHQNGFGVFAIQQQNPSSRVSTTTQIPSHPAFANDTTSNSFPGSGNTVAHPYRYHRHRHSYPLARQNGWRRQRYALPGRRAIGARKANIVAGKTGGKTGGKGDSHVKTTKSHSAKAGLQVRQHRVSSSPHPAHPVVHSCLYYDALTQILQQ